MTDRVYRHVFRVGVARFISYGAFSIFTRQAKHALVAGCMLTVRSVSLALPDPTLKYPFPTFEGGVMQRQTNVQYIRGADKNTFCA